MGSANSQIKIGVCDKETELLSAPNRRVISWMYCHSCGTHTNVNHPVAMDLELAKKCPTCKKDTAEIVLPDIGYYDDYIKVKDTGAVTYIN